MPYGSEPAFDNFSSFRQIRENDEKGFSII